MPRLYIDIHDKLLARAVKELFDPLTGYDCVNQAEADLIITDQSTEEKGKSLILRTFPLNATQLLKDIELKLQDYSIALGPYALNLRDKEWISSNRSQKLTEKEADLLTYMARRLGEDIDKGQLLEQVWGYNAALDTHTLETHIYRLRQKIEEDPAAPLLLLNGKLGYILKIPES